MTGTLKFAPGVELTISGSITPAAEKLLGLLEFLKARQAVGSGPVDSEEG